MVFDIKRIFTGSLILFFSFFSYLLKFDYLFLIVITLLVFYDLYKSKFIKNIFDYLFIILFAIIFFLISLDLDMLNYLNVTLIVLLLITLFKNNYYKKKFFLLIILIFIINLFVIFFKSRDFLYFMFFIAFYNDTLAYIFGRLIKGPLIIQKISPNKTWSGTICSFIATFIILYLFNYPIFISIILSISLFFGDIYFSFIKRNYELKDFSDILRGHGGVLDRLDSMFLFVLIMNFYI